MATPIDLYSFLRGEEPDSVQSTLERKWSEGPNDRHKWEGPYKVKAQWWAPQATAPQTVAEFSVADTDSFDIGGVLDELERQIVDELGSAPVGLTKIIIWEDGHGSYPLVRRQRQLEAPGVQGNQSKDLLMRLLLASEHRNLEMFKTMQQNNAQLVIAVNGLAQNLQQAATVRATTGGASDLSSLATLAGLGAILVLYPSIKRMLKLPADAAVEDVVTAAQLALNNAMNDDGKPKQIKGPVIPAGARGDDDDQVDELELEQVGWSAADVVAQLKENPTRMMELLAAVQGDEELKHQAEVMAKMAQEAPPPAP